jgi:hypothetical protein
MRWNGRRSPTFDGIRQSSTKPLERWDIYPACNASPGTHRDRSDGGGWLRRQRVPNAGHDPCGASTHEIRLPSGPFFEKQSEVMKNHFQRFNIMKNDYRNPQIPPAPGASCIRFSRYRRGVLFMVAGLSWFAKRDNRVE